MFVPDVSHREVVTSAFVAGGAKNSSGRRRICEVLWRGSMSFGGTLSRSPRIGGGIKESLTASILYEYIIYEFDLVRNWRSSKPGLRAAKTAREQEVGMSGILVTKATGTTGRHVVTGLAKRAVTVKAG